MRGERVGAQKHPRQRRLSRLARLPLAIVLVVGLGVTVSVTPPAHASNPTLNFFISPPTVQNTYVTGARIATFNAKTAGQACPKVWETDDGTPIGTITATKADGTVVDPPTKNECEIRAPDKFGGAVTGADDKPHKADPQNVNPGTNFVGIKTNKSVTLALANPKSYLGFWWSAGDQNNKVTLFREGKQVGAFTTKTLKDILGNGTTADLVTAIDGKQYKGCLYFGNPRKVDRTVNCQNENSSPTNDPNQPFAYVHLVGEGGLSFDTLVFTQGSAGGFEFDNMAIALEVVSPTTVTNFPAEITANDNDQTATTCQAFSTTFGITASNFSTSPTYSIDPTTLPEGLVFNPSTGGVSGTPTAAFTKQTFTITATAGNQTATADVELEVTDPGNTPCPPPPPPINPSNSSSSSNNPHTHTDEPAANSPQLAATGAPAWPVWAAGLLSAGVGLVLWTRLTQLSPVRASRLS